MLADELEDKQFEDRSAALDHCLGKLKQPQRDLLEQCYLGPTGVEAVAISMGATASAVYMRLHRIRRILVDCIDRHMAAELRI